MMTEEENARNEDIGRAFQREKELIRQGLCPKAASFRAQLESRLRNWPQEHGEYLHFMLFGDFQSPSAPIHSEVLQIEVNNIPEDRERYSHLGSHMTILRGKAKLHSMDVEGVLAAAGRVNIFLGTLSLVSRGSNSFGWWAWMLHTLVNRLGEWYVLDSSSVDVIANALAGLPPKVQSKLRSAMFWIRDPAHDELQRRQHLRLYAGYWNSLECLVDAICLLRPPATLDASERQRRLDAQLKQHEGRLALADLDRLYREIINPGLAARASHAFALCFPSFWQRYVEVCFRRRPRRDRLYDIRNAINHGDIDAENPEELARVSHHLEQLIVIVNGMFACLLPCKAFPPRIIDDRAG